MGAENGAANGGAEDKPQPTKESSHCDHRDEFVASEGLTTAGEEPSTFGGGGSLHARRAWRPPRPAGSPWGPLVKVAACGGATNPALT